MLTRKLRLTLAIALLAMPAFWAGATGIARVNQHDEHTGELGLVLNKRPQLEESPTTELGPLAASNRCALPDSLEIFKDDCGTGCLCFANEPFADYVVRVPLEIGFLASDFDEPTFRRLGAHRLQYRPPGGVLYTVGLDRIPGKCLPGRVGGDIDDAQINTQYVGRLQGCPVGHFDRTQQIELAVAVDQVCLTLDSTLAVLLVRPAHERYSEPAGQCPQADFRQTLEAQNPLIVADCPARLELGTLTFVPLETLDRLGNGPNGHLRRQAELFADVVVGPAVQGNLPEDLISEPYFRGIGGGLVEPLHRVEQVFLLLASWQKLQLECELHIGSIPKTNPVVKERTHSSAH